MSYIEKMINDLADSTWQPTSNYMWSEWVAHWIKTAEDIRKDFESKGLTTTAKWVEEWIQWHQLYAHSSDFEIDYLTRKAVR